MRRVALLLLLALLLVGGAGWAGDYRLRVINGVRYIASSTVAGAQALFDAPLNTNILDTKGAPETFTSVGPTYCFVGGQITEFADDTPRLGCEIPPGMTGGGSSGGFFSEDALSRNQVFHSLDLDSWTDVGTPAPTLTSTDLFADATQTYRICDNDAGAVEGVQSLDIDISAMNTGQKTTIWVFAKDSTGTVLDLQYVESGVCAGSTTDLAAATIDGDWSTYEWEHTLLDGTCTTGKLRFAPTDWATVASTGCAEFVVQVANNLDWPWISYVPTAGASAVRGDDYLTYDISGSGMIDGTGSLNLPLEVSFDITPAPLDGGSVVYLWEIKDTSTAVDFFRLYSVASGGLHGKLVVAGRSTAEGAQRALYTETTRFPWVQGTTYHVVVYLDLTATTVTIDGVDQPGANVSLGSAPDSLDHLTFTGIDPGTTQANTMITNFKIAPAAP